MTNFREIVTKAVVGKARKSFKNNYTLVPEQVPSTILGCWVINHKFRGYRKGDDIVVDGSCDVNIWYSFNNDTETIVTKKNISYTEIFKVTRKNESDISSNEEIIVRSLHQPTCTKVNIVENNIEYEIEKELGVEIVGDTKVRIAIDDNEDDWEIISDNNDEVTNSIGDEIKEEFLN